MLMVKVGVLSQKGGVGKSTMARDIARCFAVAGWNVKIADMDYKQTTSVDWSRRRLERNIEPHISVEGHSTVEQALKAVPSATHLLVFDGKPHSDKETLLIAKASSLVVIPSSTTLDDLNPQIRLAHELLKGGVERDRIVFVINNVVGSVQAEDVGRAIAYIKHAGYDVVEVVLPKRVAYQTAQNEGRSISEVTHPTLREAAEAVSASILHRIRKAHNDGP